MVILRVVATTLRLYFTFIFITQFDFIRQDLRRRYIVPGSSAPRRRRKKIRLHVRNHSNNPGKSRRKRIRWLCRLPQSHGAVVVEEGVVEVICNRRERDEEAEELTQAQMKLLTPPLK